MKQVLHGFFFFFLYFCINPEPVLQFCGSFITSLLPLYITVQGCYSTGSRFVQDTSWGHTHYCLAWLKPPGHTVILSVRPCILQDLQRCVRSEMQAEACLHFFWHTENCAWVCTRVRRSVVRCEIYSNTTVCLVFTVFWLDQCNHHLPF